MALLLAFVVDGAGRHRAAGPVRGAGPLMERGRPLMSMTRETDVVGVLMHDHREVEQMFTELEGLSAGDTERRRELTEKVITELVRHSVAEEAYLYPAVRDLIPGGDALADRELAEHAEAEETMKELERTDVSEARHEILMNRLIAEVRAHVQEEENMLFPKLRESTDESRLAELGHKIQAIKKIAPTHPHPSAPDTPPGNMMMGPLAGLVDRMRDALTGRGGA
ncbi:hemerythrin [Planobispora longispora]|uniref:Hemerythrin n=2 Tax=Planobispora longispora TaxID=28887 RepID=A0A8J3RWU4_9ACTN|nr:hemerythrin [Planobispora longispora]